MYVGFAELLPPPLRLLPLSVSRPGRFFGGSGGVFPPGAFLGGGGGGLSVVGVVGVSSVVWLRPCRQMFRGYAGSPPPPLVTKIVLRKASKSKLQAKSVRDGWMVGRISENQIGLPWSEARVHANYLRRNLSFPSRVNQGGGENI